MRRSCRWICWTLCLCASLALSARDDVGGDSVNDVLLDLMHEDGAVPQTGTEPAASFLRCNKVRRMAEKLDIIDLVDASTCAFADSNHAQFFFHHRYLKRNYNGK